MDVRFWLRWGTIIYNFCQLKAALRFSKLNVQFFGLRAGDDDEGFNGDNRSLINDSDTVVDIEIILSFQ